MHLRRLLRGATKGPELYSTPREHFGDSRKCEHGECGRAQDARECANGECGRAQDARECANGERECLGKAPECG